MILYGVLQRLLRETLLKKGSPSNSLPKTFALNFQPDISLTKIFAVYFISAKGYIRLKIWSKKSLERGCGGRTFPQKGLPPINRRRASV